jgi:exosortase A
MSAAPLTGLGLTFGPALAGLALGLLAWVLLFLPECTAAVGVWRASDTYGHCFLILPMALYLAWDRRGALAGLAARPMPALVVLALPITAAWFVAERLGIMEGRQLTAIAALELLFLTVLGWRLFRALLAPLLFLVFLVPFGAFVTPALQSFTAGFIVGGLNTLGIANYATDLTVEISAGVFYVAEACAGLRFLIAAVAFGVFYGLLNFRSPGRRALFIAASVVIPILANGVRALGIVVLGAVLGSAEAAAADHIIYGWVFFSLVMLLLVVSGMPFREAPPGPAPASVLDLTPAEASPVWVVVAMVALLASGPAAAVMLTRQVAPVLLSDAVSFAVPAGCKPNIGVAHPMPAQRAWASFDCAGRPLTVTTQVFPPRSTPDRLVRERRRITGELTAGEAVVSVLPTVRSENGAWSLVRTTGPGRTIAVAGWVDGVPAQAGIAGRIRQARNSLFGSSYAPILITAAMDQATRPTPAEQQRTNAILSAFVDAQTNLTSDVAAVSKAARLRP